MGLAKHHEGWKKGEAHCLDMDKLMRTEWWKCYGLTKQSVMARDDLEDKSMHVLSHCVSIRRGRICREVKVQLLLEMCMASALVETITHC